MKYLIAWGDSEKAPTLTVFRTAEAREDFIKSLRENLYSFCTAEVE